ncbi:hypothetical protein JTE90_006409 [Oedothorax gibbosus]|uniref:Splicing factor RBM39 linker domain-containing protein n=1 Tax=Oedothorax gibbosus TaxID=931172 RepID=A0AAV6VW86_9ARAC|nr:hypothetical protein JTE90_006409 [Oedothorax gibbosus]
MDLGDTGRLQLTEKLTELTHLNLSAATVPALQLSQGLVTSQLVITPPIATQFFVLSTMFDPGIRYDVVYMIQEKPCETG